MIFLMILTAICFVICTLSDRYVTSNEHIERNEFTFLVSLSMVFFLVLTLPFSKINVNFNIPNVLLILGIIVIKMTELLTTAMVLKEMTGSEMKAWIGIGSIFAYTYEVLFLGYKFNIFSILSLGILIVGLYLIVKDEKNKVNYKQILLSLFALIFCKVLYGILINKLTISFSSNITLIIVFSVISLVMLKLINVKKIFTKKNKTTKMICGTRMIDTIGNLTGNYVALRSVSNYALIQPIQLIILLLVEFITKDKKVALKSILGSILTIIGITLFQIFKYI